MKDNRDAVQKIYDAVLDFFGTWQSISTIAAFTVGLVAYGLLTKIPFSDGYWVRANLFYSIMAIFEAEIILIGQKRKDEIDTDRSIETHNHVKRTEQAVTDIQTSIKTGYSNICDKLSNIEEDVESLDECNKL